MNPHIARVLRSVLPLVVLLVASAQAQAPAPALQRAQPPGGEKSARTCVLEAGAWALQADAPTDLLNIYLVGFHPARDEPAH